VPEPVRRERQARLMQVQQEISRARLARAVGGVRRVLVDEVSPAGAIARSSADAPEIDGVVRVAADPRLKVGEFYEVRITGSADHDLSGVLA